MPDLRAQRRRTGGRRARALAVIGPVVAVALLFGIVLGSRLHTYHGNVTGFVLFGRRFAPYTHPPRGAVILSPSGYDGQFFYLQAKDPLAIESATITSFRDVGQAFRLQRLAYPGLAYLFAAGQTAAIPWSLLTVNLLVVLLITVGFAVYAERRGWSPWWSLAVGLQAGFLTGTLRDLSDPLAVATMLAGIMMWQRRARWWTAALLTVAVLSREPMALALAAIAVDAALRAWQVRHEPSSVRRVAWEAWPALLVPTAAFIAWHAYLDARYGGNLASSSLAFLPPFKGVLAEIRHGLDDPSLRDTAWDLAYLGLMLAGVVVAVSAVWRKVSVSGLAAALFGLLLLVLVFGDPWSYTRLSAPMFATLLLYGLQRRSRPALVVCGAAAVLTIVVPFAPWLGTA